MRKFIGTSSVALALVALASPALAGLITSDHYYWCAIGAVAIDDDPVTSCAEIADAAGLSEEDRRATAELARHTFEDVAEEVYNSGMDFGEEMARDGD